MGKRKAQEISKTTSSQENWDDKDYINQKKTIKDKSKTNKKHHFIPSKNYELQCSFLKKTFKFNKKDAFICQICPKNSSIKRNNLMKHLKTANHRMNTKKLGTSFIEDLDKDLDDCVKEIKTNKRCHQSGDTKDKKNYMEFLAFGMKENLSFLQIQAISKQLREMVIENKIGFFKNNFFDKEEISEVARGLGECILEEIAQDLSKTKFSFSIDSCTLHNKNICGLKVRYLKQNFDENGVNKSHIESKIVGIKYLEESSQSSIYYDIIKEKLFNLNENIKDNLVGVVHDHAKVLSGTKDGLMGIMMRDCQNYFFNLGDPCHALNLALSQSLESFSRDVTQFVDKIHAHFSSSPQRVAKLINLQKSENNKPLGLNKYVKSRWLSFGQSLLRLLEIWTPLRAYMEQNQKEYKECNQFLDLLQNPSFKLQIIFLSGVVSKINKSNTVYQSQCLEIQNLKSEMVDCIKNISRLFIKNEELANRIFELKEKYKNNSEIQKEEFLDQESFIERMINDVDSRLIKISSMESEEKLKLIEQFQAFLSKLLSLLLKELPFENEIIGLLDFVTLNLSSENLRSKILQFSNKFRLIPFEDLQKLSDEINMLCNEDLLWARISAKGSSLYLWDLVESSSESIEGVSKYNILSRIFKTAHTLPTSSAGLAEFFSSQAGEKCFKKQFT